MFTELLLDHGADIDSLDAGGQRPIDLAAENKCDDCVAAISNKLGGSSVIFCLISPLFVCFLNYNKLFSTNRFI